MNEAAKLFIGPRIIDPNRLEGKSPRREMQTEPISRIFKRQSRDSILDSSAFMRRSCHQTPMAAYHPLRICNNRRLRVEQTVQEADSIGLLYLS